MVAVAGRRSGPFVVARSADRQVRDLDRPDQPVVVPGMADADRPWPALAVAPAEIEVAAGVDREIPERPQFLRREVDGQSLGHGAEIEHQGAQVGDGALCGVEADIPERGAGICRGLASLFLARAIVSIESTGRHPAADSGIEGPAGFLCDGQGELDRLVENRADLNRGSRPGAEPPEFALRVEAAAGRLHLLKPRESAVDRLRRLHPAGGSSFRRQHLDPDHGAHQGGSALVRAFHSAFFSASRSAL